MRIYVTIIEVQSLIVATEHYIKEMVINEILYILRRKE